MLHHYAKIEKILDLGVDGYPKEYPVLFIATDEELHEFSKLMAEAILKGFNPKWRRIYFSNKSEAGYTHERVFNILQDLPDITEKEHTLLMQIPHWDIRQDAVKVLDNYIKMVDASVEQYEGSELQKAVTDIINKVRDENEGVYYA